MVKNSIDAMPDSGRILLTMTVERKGIVVSVVDNGKGIDSADLPYVMDPFYTTKKLTHSFGLGLTQGYSIMQQHKGDMQVLSEEGKGTTVRLVFPRKWLGRKTAEGMPETKTAVLEY